MSRGLLIALLCFLSPAGLTPAAGPIIAPAKSEAEQEQEKFRAQFSERLPIPSELLRCRKERYYGIYDKKRGLKFGWARSSQSPQAWHGREAVRVENLSTMSFRLENEIVLNISKEELFFDAKPPHRLLQAVQLEVVRNRKKAIVLTHQDGEKYAVEVEEAGEKRRDPSIELDFLFADLTSCDVWALDEKRRRGDRYCVRGLEISDLCVVPLRYQWERREVEMHDGKETPLVQVTVENLAENFTCIYHIDPTGQWRRGVVAETTEFRAEPEAIARKVVDAPDLFAGSLVPCSEKLGRPALLTDLEVSLTGPDVTGIPDTVHQTVRFSGDGRSAHIKVSAQPGTPRAATAEEIKRCLQATAELPLADERIRKLAAQAVGAAKTTQGRVRSILGFVSKFVADDYGAEPLGLLELLKKKRGDCTEHALLFTALARANGIPCREVTGYMYIDAKQAFGGHAWNEVVIDGHWVPVDPTWNQFPPDASHIQLSSGKVSLRDSKFLSGGMAIKVLAVKRKAP